jgi:hypothetical protein
LMMDAIVFLIEAGQVCFLVKAIWTWLTLDVFLYVCVFTCFLLKAI